MSNLIATLKNRFTKNSTEMVDERQQEIATVQVRDIKQYLVDEYERSRKLFEQNEYLRKQLEKTEETRTKYDATLVTLDEYKKRLESKERAIERRNDAIDSMREQIRSLQEELNDYKIAFSRASITRDEIKEEVIDATKAQLIGKFAIQKGTISKQRIVEIIRECEIVLPEEVVSDGRKSETVI